MDAPAPTPAPPQVTQPTNNRGIIQRGLETFNVASWRGDVVLAGRVLKTLYRDTTSIHDEEFEDAWEQILSGHLLDFINNRPAHVRSSELEEAHVAILQMLDRRGMGMQMEGHDALAEREKALIANLERGAYPERQTGPNVELTVRKKVQT